MSTTSRSTNRKAGRDPLSVRRLPVTFSSDIRRVITRFFDPGGEARIRSVVDRVNRLSGGEVDRLLDEVFLKFRTRHGKIAAALEENYRAAMEMVGLSDDSSQNRRLLIGSCFTAEYSIESAALFTPSIVPHHNQRNLPAGAVRFITSLRATGEGHVSSIVSRSGVIYSDERVQIDPCSRLSRPARVVPDKQYDKPCFGASSKTSVSTRGRWIWCWTALATLSPWRKSNMPSPRRALRHPTSCDLRHRSRTSVGWPIRTTSWSFRGK
jgi:hypothetical protein